MIGYDQQDLADSYFLAGDTLIAAVLDERETGRSAINPVLYVYRHGIELYLKCIVQPLERTHSLGALLEAFCRHIRMTYKESVPAWITKPVSESATFDPTSDVFRYEHSSSQNLQNQGEF